MAIASRGLAQIAPLIAPPVISVFAIDSRHDAGTMTVALALLAGLAVVTIGGLAMRASTDRGEPHPWAILGVLTPTGRNVMWTSTLAIFLGSYVGWASLDVVGLFGMTIVYLAVGWIALVGSGDGPSRRGKLERSIVPEVTREGDPLRDEIRISGIRIAPGLRLFVYAETCAHGAIVRHVVGSTASRSSVELHADIGFARRGVHVAEPFAMWFGDVLGLVRLPAMPGVTATWTVMPRPATVDNTGALLGRGRDATETVSSDRLPTEGTFRIREYAAGDDARRIHWVRSLQANRLVVRLPDEIPVGEPAVRVIADCELPDEPLRCRGHLDLLDALVRTWLGVGEALAAAGVRVTMTSAVRTDDGVVAASRPLQPRSSREAVRLGARVAWQSTLRVDDLVSRDGIRQIVVTAKPRAVHDVANIVWIIVPESVWAESEDLPSTPSPLTLPYDMGVPDNRRDRQRRERERLEVRWNDRVMLSSMVGWRDLAEWSGSYVARPDGGRTALQVVP